MEITLKKEKGSCIQKDLKLKLGDYTILAGENNTGKTSIISAIRNHDDIKKEYGDRIIYVPSDSVHPEKTELKRTATKDAFYKTLDVILEPIFNSTIFKKLVEDFEKSPEKKYFIDGVNEILNKDLGVDKKKFDMRILADDLTRDIIIKEAIQTYVRDLYDTAIEEVDLDSIGMGTQRMIITALIQSYSKIKEKEKMLIIIEEPEIYLHPKWKRNLYNALIKLSESFRVLITTHDPYFIEMGSKQTIYKVSRDPGEKDATRVDLVEDSTGKLGYKSDGEINYLIFGVPSESYLMELYEHVKDSSKKGGRDFETFLFERIKDTAQYEHDTEPWKLTYVSRLRHNLAHPKDVNKRKVKIDLSDRIEDAIKDLIELS